ncbi:hypothetical protein HYX17_00575 [Candidatus Woesearchaeota archaeon]|nr:hypothetical protein [Candidatus Woesearchaeota archaeon]
MVGLIVPVENNGINSGNIFGYGARLKRTIEENAGINVCIGISAYPTNAKSKDELIESAKGALNGAKYNPNRISIS